MDMYTATEEAYKKGYEAGKRDAVVHAVWRLNEDGSGTCMRCHRTTKGVWDYDNYYRYCPDCGAMMGLEVKGA